MPIRPENKNKYPKYWKYLSIGIIVGRAKNRCEWCGARKYKPHPKTRSKVVLTVAHLDHNPKNSNPKNLKALCQKCHLSYDLPRKIKEMKARRRMSNKN